MNKQLPKLIIIGHGRHGKDTVCDILQRDYNFKFMSSSQFCNEKVLFPVLSPIYGYTTLEECYNDRHNHRKEWYDLIAEHNSDDPARLGKELFSQFDIYCGLRRKEELEALTEQDVCDYIIWVDASKRLPPEDESSCTVTKDMSDYVIDNNEDYDSLLRNVKTLFDFILDN
jgi:dephospho-CoA kinase